MQEIKAYKALTNEITESRSECLMHDLRYLIHNLRENAETSAKPAREPGRFYERYFDEISEIAELLKEADKRFHALVWK